MDFGVGRSLTVCVWNDERGKFPSVGGGEGDTGR